MARRMFPDDRLVYAQNGAAGAILRGSAGSTATVYTDAAGTTLASILNEDGSANASSTLTVDAYTRLPLFQGPTDGTDTLYVSVAGGPVVAVYARADDRIDEVNAALASAPTTAWVEPAASAGWSIFGAPYEVPRYRKFMGIVFLEGLVQNTSGGALGTGSPVFVLPIGFRPRATVNAAPFSVAGLEISAAGDVRVNNSIANGAFLTLCMSFVPA